MICTFNKSIDYDDVHKQVEIQIFDNNYCTSFCFNCKDIQVDEWINFLTCLKTNVSYDITFNLKYGAIKFSTMCGYATLVNAVFDDQYTGKTLICVPSDALVPAINDLIDTVYEKSVNDI